MREPARTFCGLPFVNLARLGEVEAEVAVFGAPHGTPYRPGAPGHSSEAPGAIRAALDWPADGRERIDMDTGLPVMAGARAVDLGDVPGDPADAGVMNRAAIRGAAQAIRSRGVRPLMLGGDDSTPIPFLEAWRGSEIWVVQIDAHLDWRDEIGGVTHGYSSTMRRASEMAHVSGIVQIGARGTGSARAGELAAARDWGAHLVAMREIHRAGIGAALAAIPEGAEMVLSIDADALDPALCPGVRAPAFGGLGYQTMLDLLEGIAARGRVTGAAFVEYAPDEDPSGRGAQAVARLCCHLIAILARRERAT